MPPHARGRRATVIGVMTACVMALLIAAIAVWHAANSKRATTRPVGGASAVRASESLAKSVVRVGNMQSISPGRHSTTGEPLVLVGSGLGFAVDREGYIITAYHVVARAKRIMVTLSDKSSVSARLVIYHQSDDVAVIKVDGRAFPSLKLGDSRLLRSGQTVLTVNSSFAAHSARSLTRGVILDLDFRLRGRVSPLILISNSAGAGASGGPVLDAFGRVIGITVASSAPIGRRPNAAHVALPVNAVRLLLSKLRRGGVAHNMSNAACVGQLRGVRHAATPMWKAELGHSDLKVALAPADSVR